LCCEYCADKRTGYDDNWLRPKSDFNDLVEEYAPAYFAA
jgi:hypothetical protein